MTTITIEDIKRDLISCLQRVKAGETLVVLEENELWEFSYPEMTGEGS